MNMTMPDPKRIFKNGLQHTRAVTLRAYMPPLTSDDYPIIEIGWQFPASIEAFHKLEAFQLITGEPLETEVYGAKLVLITTWNQMIAAQFFLNCDKQVCDVLTSIIGTCNRDELERIVFQTTDEIKHMYWKETEV